jgi:hypothetical protein
MTMKNGFLLIFLIFIESIWIYLYSIAMITTPPLSPPQGDFYGMVPFSGEPARRGSRGASVLAMIIESEITQYQ